MNTESLLPFDHLPHEYVHAVRHFAATTTHNPFIRSAWHKRTLAKSARIADAAVNLILRSSSPHGQPAPMMSLMYALLLRNMLARAVGFVRFNPSWPGDMLARMLRLCCFAVASFQTGGGMVDRASFA
jgi:hypothetical protein